MRPILAFLYMCSAAQAAGSGGVVRAGLPLAILGLAGLVALRRRNANGSGQ